ncbi:MAG TPA: ribose-phosphate pyrophosphokinase [bacterium]|nr:ribose-phosphate pyrophosphokinase [bacterium]
MVNDLVLLAGTAHPELAGKISAYIGVPLANMEVWKFANDNTFCKINENIRKRDVFVIQPTCRPVNDTIMELLIIMDACKRASADSITAVVPYYGYARSDKKDQPRVPITAKLVADIISEAGADRIICMDLHAEAIQGFFNIPVDHLYSMPIFIEYLKDHDPRNMVIVSPDAGGVARARAYAKRLGADLAIIDKRRVGNNDNAEVLHVIGEVKDKSCVLVDDIIDTAGSITKAAAILMDRGARKVRALAAHAELSDPARERLLKSAISEVVVADTIPIPPDKMIDKIKVLSVAPILGETIKRIHKGDSVSSLFV